MKKQTELKRSLASIEFSSHRWDDLDMNEPPFFEEEAPKVHDCIYCGCEYALGPDLARFCSQCAKPIPKYSECEPEKVFTGCTGVCKACNSFVPLDGSNCPVCDAEIESREVEQTNFNAEGQKICDRCSRTSPPDASSCQFCDKVGLL